MRTIRFFNIALILAVAAPLSGQTLDGPRRAPTPVAAAFTPAPAPAEPRSVALLGTVGALTGVASVYGGALLGAVIAEKTRNCDQCEYGFLEGMFAGAVGLPPIAIPLAVHAANGGRGSWAKTMGASMLAGAATLLVGFKMQSQAMVFIAPPVAELIAAVAVERLTSDER